jgi:hypothetical protein
MFVLYESRDLYHPYSPNGQLGSEARTSELSIKRAARALGYQSPGWSPLDWTICWVDLDDPPPYFLSIARGAPAVADLLTL